MVSEFWSVGQLRKLLDGLPDDRQIVFQVIATEGGAWNLQAQFAPSIGPNCSFSVLQLKHPELTRLQWPAPETPVEPVACGVDVGFNFTCRRARGHEGPHVHSPDIVFGEKPL